MRGLCSFLLLGSAPLQQGVLSCSKAFPLWIWNPHPERSSVSEAARVPQRIVHRAGKGQTRSWQQDCSRYTSSVPPSLSSSKSVAATVWFPLPLTVFWPEIVTWPQSSYKGGWEICGSTWTLWSVTISSTLVWENLRNCGPAVHCWFCLDLVNLLLGTAFQILIPVPRFRTPMVTSLPWCCTLGRRSCHWKAICESGSLQSATYLICLLHFYVIPDVKFPAVYVPPVCRGLCLLLVLSASLYLAAYCQNLPSSCGHSPQPDLLWFDPSHHHPRPGSDRKKKHKEKGEKVHKRKPKESGKVM